MDKPYDLNINEHHKLWITYYLKNASISEIAKLGVMHVSTAFNFSKKLETRGYLQYSKKENDMRNTYIQLTEKGEELVLTIFKNYEPLQNPVFREALPLQHLYGKFPDFIEMWPLFVAYMVMTLWELLNTLSITLKKIHPKRTERSNKWEVSPRFKKALLFM